MVKSYTIPDFGPSDLMTSETIGARRLKVEIAGGGSGLTDAELRATPVNVSIVSGSVLAPKEVRSGVDGVVAIPAGARLDTVSAMAFYNATATVEVDTLDAVTIPEGGSYTDSFAHSLEGSFDITFTGTRQYYVTYYTGIVPSDVILL
jgi:hypothetical protein